MPDWPVGLIGVGIVVANNYIGSQRDRRWVEVPPAPEPVPLASTWTSQPLVSVLVAAWNESGNIDEHLRSFLTLDYPNRELLLAAGGDDDTLERARRWAGPRVIVQEQQPGEGKQAALRRLLPAAQGIIVLLADADCEFSDEAFFRLVAPIATEGAAVVTGGSEPKLALRDNPLVQYQWFGDLYWSARRPLIVDGILGRNAALRRDVLAAIGGFDREVHTGTDYVMSQLLRHGRHEIRFAPQSRVRTEYPATPNAYLRMWRRWNKNLLIHGPRFGAWRDVRGVMVAIGVYAATLGLGLLAPLLGPVARTVSLILFAVAAVGRYRRLAAGARLAGRQLEWKLLAAVPFYTVLDMLGVLWAVADAIRPGARRRW